MTLMQTQYKVINFTNKIYSKSCLVNAHSKVYDWISREFGKITMVP